MIRTYVTGSLAVLSVAAIAVLPTACAGGGVGDPCIPEDEYDPNFAGFPLREENIESRSFQCETRICLVNHFQGRVSCPLGQAARTLCTPGGGGCEGGQECVPSTVLAPECETDGQCEQFAGVCNDAGKFCECSSDEHCPEGLSCDTESKQCKQFVCHTPGNCQTADGENSTDQGCCVPGTDTPVAPSVCGQCGDRGTEQAVFCSCRCGPAEGESEDENFNFCECPDGFECSEIRPNVGLGDQQLTGKYCVPNGTDTDPQNAALECGTVDGAFNSNCSGTQG